MKARIRRELLDYLLEMARSFYPNEFAGLLREKDGIFEEVLLFPKGYYGRESVFFDTHLLPHDEDVKGTVHSHPGPPRPSKADLDFFSKFGGVHLIIGFPFEYWSVKAYTSDGKEIGVEIVP